MKSLMLIMMSVSSALIKELLVLIALMQGSIMVMRIVITVVQK